MSYFVRGDIFFLTLYNYYDIIPRPCKQQSLRFQGAYELIKIFIDYGNYLSVKRPSEQRLTLDMYNVDVNWKILPTLQYVVTI